MSCSIAKEDLKTKWRCTNHSNGNWLATLRGLPANAVEIWYSRWPPGARLVMTAGYLRRELPGVKVKLCDWDRYGFLVAPERWARALRVRSVANTTNCWVR